MRETGKPPEDGSALRKQAEELRRSLRRDDSRVIRGEMGLGTKLALAGFIFSVLAVSLLLLGSAGARRTVVTTVASLILPSSRQLESELYLLPAPPPKSPEPRTVYGGDQPGPRIPDEYDGVLYRDIQAEGEQGSEEQMASDSGFVPPEKSPESVRAFEVLKRGSETAAALSENRLDGYQYRDWMVLKDDSPAFLIDLLALRRSDDKEYHVVWEVNIDSGEVRPMSQAARDLAQR